MRTVPRAPHPIRASRASISARTASRHSGRPARHGFALVGSMPASKPSTTAAHCRVSGVEAVTGPAPNPVPGSGNGSCAQRAEHQATDGERDPRLRGSPRAATDSSSASARATDHRPGSSRRSTTTQAARAAVINPNSAPMAISHAVGVCSHRRSGDASPVSVATAGSGFPASITREVAQARDRTAATR